MLQRQAGKLLVTLLPLLLLVSCNKGPEGPAKGSPEWNYQAAKESFRLGEYEAAEEALSKIENAAGNPFQARAAAWHIAIEVGQVTGYGELIEAYEKGSLKAAGKRLDFLRLKQADMKEAKRHGLHLLDTYLHFEETVLKQSSPSVVLESPFPLGSATPVVDLERVYKGLWMVDDARALMHQAVLKRGMIRGYSAVLTAIDDAPGAQKALEKGRAEIPTAKFLLVLGQTAAKAAPVFGRTMLDETAKEKLFWERAQACATKILESKPDAALEKDAKKLKADADKALKPKK
jgi:hypothetical protein